MTETARPRVARSRSRSKRGQSRILRGRAITQGIGLGAAGRVETLPLPQITTRLSQQNVDVELQRFEEAVARAQHQIEKIRRRLVRLPEGGREDVSGLLTVYDRMLGPSRLTRQVRQKIEDDGLTAEAAVTDVSAELAQRVAETSATVAPALQEDADTSGADAALRLAGEFEEIGRRLVRNLTGVSYRAFSSLPEGAVLVAEQLRPADIAMIDPARVAAVVTEGNGGADHTAILLRALDIPAILAVPGLMAQIAEGDMLVVDAHLGTITINPNATELRLAREAASREARERRAFGRIRRLPAELRSGESIELLANLELPSELPMLVRNGARGIGLLRSEFLFGDEDDLPDEDGQAEIYRAVLEGMAGQPVTIRVFDWGGEKGQDYLRYADQPQSVVGDNPALGLRGIRLLLKAPSVLETQFAAILKAASATQTDGGSVRVLLPMVTSVDEVITAREIYERVARGLRREGLDVPEPLPPLGVMVETPAAALIADALVQHAEFLALGTNDLTMYTLAVNRADAAVADRYSPLHPAVLRLIAMTAESALRAHRPLSVCGEMAADPRIVALLIGLGVRSFSMKSASLPRVKRLIRTVSFEECDLLRREVMLMNNAEAVQDALRQFAV